MPAAYRNSYRLAVDRNHNQRLEIRIEAHYVRPNWTLRVFFLASTPERALTRALHALRFLHREEEKLWLWGADPSDRALLFDDLLARADLRLDRRHSFPRTAIAVIAACDQPLTPLLVAETRRKLATRLSTVARLPRSAELVAQPA